MVSPHTSHSSRFKTPPKLKLFKDHSPAPDGFKKKKKRSISGSLVSTPRSTQGSPTPRVSEVKDLVQGRFTYTQLSAAKLVLIFSSDE